MAASLHQQKVAEYHNSMAQQGHHGAHNMFVFHGRWHNINREPEPPTSPDRQWGIDNDFGTRFLQMHHEMVSANGTEQKQFMTHDSITEWYKRNGESLPKEWNPLTIIPNELGYDPDMSIFPADLQNALTQWARREGRTPEALLSRRTNQPNFELPRWYTREGVGEGEQGDRYTGARRLADFQNINQLGCSILFPHNRWHSIIGGAMNNLWTAIADPIFYFGVHWRIDQVFDEYKSIQSERVTFRHDIRRLIDLKSVESERVILNRQFTDEERLQREKDIEISEQLHTNLTEFLINP